MPDIHNPITYSATEIELIALKLNDEGFTHKNWSDDDLQALRSVIRKFYRNEQLGECAYCKHPVSLMAASNCHVEHIAPKSTYRDFIFEPKNLCVICADCNEIKRGQETIGEVIDPVVNGSKRKMYPRSSSAFKIVHPHFDIYKENIVILNGKYYLDKTPKGNFTIYACNLNRSLYQFGWQKEVIDEAQLLLLMSECVEEKDPATRKRLIDNFKEILLLA